MSPEEVLLTGFAPIHRAVDNYGQGQRQLAMTQVNHAENIRAQAERQSFAKELLGIQHEHSTNLAAITDQRERERIAGYLKLAQERESANEKKERLKAAVEQGRAYGVSLRPGESDDEFSERVTRAVADGILAARQDLAEGQSQVSSLLTGALSDARKLYDAKYPVGDVQLTEAEQAERELRIAATVPRDVASRIYALQEHNKSLDQTLKKHMERPESLPALTLINKEHKAKAKAAEAAEAARAALPPGGPDEAAAILQGPSKTGGNTPSASASSDPDTRFWYQKLSEGAVDGVMNFNGRDMVSNGFDNAMSTLIGPFDPAGAVSLQEDIIRRNDASLRAPVGNIPPPTQMDIVSARAARDARMRAMLQAPSASAPSQPSPQLPPQIAAVVQQAAQASGMSPEQVMAILSGGPTNRTRIQPPSLQAWRPPQPASGGGVGGGVPTPLYLGPGQSSMPLPDLNAWRRAQVILQPGAFE